MENTDDASPSSSDNTDEAAVPSDKDNANENDVPSDLDNSTPKDAMSSDPGTDEESQEGNSSQPSCKLLNLHFHSNFALLPYLQLQQKNIQLLLVTMKLRMKMEKLKGLLSMSHAVVDGEVSPPILLVLNLTQLKSHGIRLWKRLIHMKPVLPMTKQEP